MKKVTFVFLCILTICVTFKPTQVKASHAAGGELIYEWLSDSTYRFFFKFYRDCTGISPDPTYPLCIENTNCPNVTPPPSQTMNPWNGTLPGGGHNGSPVSPGCTQSNYPDKCTNPNSPVPGYEEWWYSCIVTLPGKCNFWTFSTTVNARNTSTSNISPLGSLYIETTFNNLLFQGNSSPYFSVKPVPYVCINSKFDFNNGAIDPNGDSIVTDLIMPRNGACGSITPTTFTNGSFSLLNNPFPTVGGNSFVLNPKTGKMSFTSNATGTYALATRVREFRKGRLIGYIVRDLSLQVLQCTGLPPTAKPKGNIPGGAYDAKTETINGCINQQLSFCFDITSQVRGDGTIFVLKDNHQFSLPSATVVYTNQASDSVRACVTWFPHNSTDTGNHGFIVLATDSTCLPPGIMLTYNIDVNIHIWPQVIALKDQSICPTDRAYLTAQNGEDYQWTALPGGSGNSSLSCTSCTSPQAFPLKTTTYAVLSTTNPYCPDINKDTVTVTVFPAPIYTPLTDEQTCPRNPIKLDLQSAPPPGAKYTFQWTPTTYLSNPASGEPICNPLADISYKVVMSTSESICTYTDDVNVDVLDGFLLKTQDTAICEGQSVQVATVGDTRYQYNWTTNTPPGGYGFSDAKSSTPLINQSLIGKFVYTLTASYTTITNHVCKDSINYFVLEIQPNPTVKLDPDTKMCLGDTMKLVGHVIPSDYPYSLSWSPSTALNNATVIDPILSASAEGDMTLTLTASSSAQCTASDDINITVFPANFMTVSNDTAICPGDSVQMHLSTVGGQSFRWSPDININNTKGYDPTVWPVATQTYAVYGIDTNSCHDTEMVKITVKPAATLRLPDSVRLYPGESYRMEPLGNCSYFSWFPPVGLSKDNISNPIAQPDVNTHYILNATTESGCTTSAAIDVFVNPDSYIDVPNAFTPGSGLNNIIKVVHLGDAKLKSFTIYNRWGQKMFETSDLNGGWDGKFKGESQPMGVYIYTVEAVTPSGRIFNKQGNITLIR